MDEAIIKVVSNSILSLSVAPIAFAAVVLVNEVSDPETLVPVVVRRTDTILVFSGSNVLICVNPVLII